MNQNQSIDPISESPDSTLSPAPPPAQAGEPAPIVEPPVYRWTYAEQVAHDKTLAATKKRKGVGIYALVMTGVFLVSFSLLIAVLCLGGGSRSNAQILRPGIATPLDEEAVEGVEQAKRSVVVIETKSPTQSGAGSGIILTEDGYIATNHHVIDGATSVRVTFYDGTVMMAEIVGSSEMDDLGVIKVNAKNLPAATFADSDQCYVGQTVYAIGTPVSTELGWSATKGIISYMDREIKMYADDGTLHKKLRLIQTDANINPGNSGGPLINTNGEVIGVVSMRLADGYVGIGFAIPSDGAVEILEAIMQYGNADSINSSLSHKRPMLGITCADVVCGNYYQVTAQGVRQISADTVGQYDPSQVFCADVSGVYVINFMDGMHAAEVMQTGDIITAVGSRLIADSDQLMDIINEYYAGDTVTLTVFRNGASVKVEIVLSAQTGA